jgi:hypothetical protein
VFINSVNERDNLQDLWIDGNNMELKETDRKR